jgi:hypothetical protein
MFTSYGTGPIFVANSQRIIVPVLFTPKIFTKLSKIWVWDPGSEIRDPEKAYSISRIHGSKRHRIPHCYAYFRVPVPVLSQNLKKGLIPQSPYQLRVCLAPSLPMQPFFL